MLIITLEGGLVTGIFSEDPKLIGEHVIVQNFDAEGADDAVEDAGGIMCCPHRDQVKAIRLNEVLDLVDLCTKREAASIPIHCDRCEAQMIQGVFYHETGCPNSRAHYNPITGLWEPRRICGECGNSYNPDEGACCEGNG